MNRAVYRGLFILGAGVVLAGCEQAPKSPVIAQLQGAEVTADELQGRLAETPAGYQQYAASPEGRRQFLNLLIREKLLLVEARKAGLQREPAYRNSVKRFKAGMKR